MRENRRVLVGMSGGIDSSIVCILLQKRGFEVVGVTMRMWDSQRHFKEGDIEPDYILSARRLAQQLGIVHHVIDARAVFKNEVVDYFTSEYLNGRTPNPCVRCNRVIKWDLMRKLADELDCWYLATGHYANVVCLNDNYYISKGRDVKKDQSYFLWDVDPSIWERVLFPLGEITKNETRDIAKQLGFTDLYTQKESMEICFVESDYRDFLKVHCSDQLAQIGQGDYVDREGKKLGSHEGYPFYTIGQRKGLRIALGVPAFVLKINPLKNTVMLGERSDVEAFEMVVENYRVVSFKDFEEPVSVQIRYRSAGIPAQIIFVDETLLLVRFLEVASSVAPGQSAVFYKEGIVLGGGVIGNDKCLKSAKKRLKRLQESNLD